ncbi:hypothetical protein [Rhizobium sp. AC27/96]|nr:hypothetical protein [Rhizobium sp. AC27/96]
MSSAHGINFRQDVLLFARQFRLMDLFIESTWKLSVAFIAYVILRGILW